MLVVKLKGIEHKSCYKSQAGYVVDDEYIIDIGEDYYAIPLEDIESIDVVEDKSHNLYEGTKQLPKYTIDDTEWLNMMIMGMKFFV